MLKQETVVHDELQNGICFFCGDYVDSIAIHETKVHGKDRSRQNEVY